MRPALPVLAAGTLAAAALLVPTAASADTQSPWLRQHHQTQSQKRVNDPNFALRWHVVNHKVTVLARDRVAVPFVYSCGDAQNPTTIAVSPGVFQDTYSEDDKASAYFESSDDDTVPFPVFTCDSKEHTLKTVLTADPEDSAKGFENGTVEVGILVLGPFNPIPPVPPVQGARTSPSGDETIVPVEDGIPDEFGPRFEHAVVGTNKVRDARAKVAVTVNATPETTPPGSKITVKGTVKRNGTAYQGKAASLYFQSNDRTPAVQVGSATASSRGTLTTKVTVTGPGTYFWTTTSTSKTQKGSSTGDYAASARV
ncbi:hypothetical protein SAMN04488544_3353 [Microlunatus sagamiharensis]|uniref:Uncharacterized protein n=1 Tax=Microlunatus sagamiharensis TaxID=546874 RepID=A0A1H2N6F0_9ACTN|nr:hypothetical protein [Microlunatus sagamiharensis]SDV00665.1 hypothetical protein SAMN04488544_3353 [Microlunatus sagamiharensis]